MGRDTPNCVLFLEKRCKGTKKNRYMQEFSHKNLHICEKSAIFALDFEIDHRFCVF